MVHWCEPIVCWLDKINAVQGFLLHLGLIITSNGDLSVLIFSDVETEYVTLDHAIGDKILHEGLHTWVLGELRKRKSENSIKMSLLICSAQMYRDRGSML